MVSEGLSQQTIPERSLTREVLRWTRKTTCALAATACLAVGAGVGYEEMQGERLEPLITRLDSKETCRESVFIAVFLSGIGLQTAIHSAYNNHPAILDNDGCTFAVEDYGTRLDIEKISEQLVSAITETLGENQDAQILFVGNSYGTIGAQKIADSDTFRNSPRMHAAGFFAQATPAGPECVRGIVERTLVYLSNPNVSWGKTPLLVMNVMGLFERQDFADQQARDDALYNTRITDSRLMAREMYDIKNGFPTPLPPKQGDAPATYWYQFIKADKVQDPACSAQGIEAKVRKIGSPFIRLEVEPINTLGNKEHGSDWWLPDLPKYTPSNSIVFNAMKVKFSPEVSDILDQQRKRRPK